MGVVSISDPRAPLHSRRGVTPVLVISVIALALSSLSLRADPTWAQDFDDEEPQPIISDHLSNEEIEKNESRLKMLEEELLHNMDARPPKVPRKTPTKTAIVLREEPSFVRTLHEIADHPALRGKPNRASSSVTSGVPIGSADQRATNFITSEELDILQRKLSVSDAALVKELEKGYGARAVRTAGATDAQLRSTVRAKKSTRSVDAQQGRPIGNEWIVGRSAPKRDNRIKRSLVEPAVYSEVEAPKWINNQRTSAIASVAVDNATLHIGPDRREFALSPISRSSVVTVERRHGEWYRVVTATGHRGWLAGGSLLFNANVPRDSTVRVRGYQLRFEPMRLRF